MMSLKSRKRISYVVLGLFYFMGGVEYAVVLPTLWLYIKTKFHAEKYALGILLAAYSFAALIASPLFGRWVDKSRKPKLTLLFSVLWQMGGSAMYFMGISEWFVLGSRLVAGVGAGGESVILAEITRVTTEEERTGIISTMVSMRQMGLLIGPGLNLFLRLANFNIGPFLIDKYTVPGAFMVCVWAFQGLLILCLYTDLHTIKTMELQAAEEIQNYTQTSGYGSMAQDASDTEKEYTIQNVEENREKEDRKNSTGSYGSTSTPAKLTLSLLYNEYVREEIIVIFSLQFNTFFNQIALETMATPLSDKLLHWGEVENSIMYCVAGVEIIGVFFLVRLLSKRLQDRTMILFGAVVLTVANVWFIYVVPRASPDTPSENLPKLAVGIILDMLALPFLAVCSVSLYSKLTRKEIQGFSQGLRRSVVGVSAILAPLWAGSTIDTPYIMYGVNIGLISMSVIMLVISFKRLVPSNRIQEAVIKEETYRTGTSDRTDESKPLLS